MKESAMKAMSPKKAMKESPNKIMKGGAKKDPDYYKKGNFMDIKKSEQERIDKKAYGPEGAPATVKPKKGRDTLTTAIPQSTIGKKLKDKAGKETNKPKKFPTGSRHIESRIKKIDRKLLNPNENRPKYGSAKKAMKESPKKRMTDDKLKKYSKATTTRKTPPGGGEKYAEMMERTKKLRERGDNKYKTLKKEMSPKKRMTRSKAAEARKAVSGKGRAVGVKASAKAGAAKGVKQRSMTKMIKTRFVDTSPKKKTIAKDKDPKFKRAARKAINNKSQASFEPMYEGADISRAEFNKMSKREQRKYIKNQTDF
tara:strand:- start:207 stop:1142 length:936 start_codon:yes stop_codon:yes gene_type:complete